MNRQIIHMLQAALNFADVTVLTNAAAPIVRYFNDLQTLHRGSDNKLTLRISMGHCEEARHDAIRGAGMFQKTLENTIKLCRRGIRTIITTEVTEFDLRASLVESFQLAVPLKHQAWAQYCCIEAGQSSCAN